MQVSFVDESKFTPISNLSDIDDPDEFPTINENNAQLKTRMRMPRMKKRTRTQKRTKHLSDEDSFDFDAYIADEKLKITVNKLFDTLPSNHKDEDFTGYIYENDQTLDGPDSQWELLKYARVDNYETQKEKAKRLNIEKIIQENEAKVAREAKIGPRATTLSAWDSVVSDSESDSDNQDAAWLDELLEENSVEGPPKLEASDDEEEKHFVGMSPDVSFNSSRLRKESGEAATPR